jgi:hypothetical protein
MVVDKVRVSGSLHTVSERSVTSLTSSQVSYISNPRLEYTDDALNVVVENLTLSGRNLFLNVTTT